MTLLTSIIDLESIQVPSSDFKPESHATEIEALARTMLHLQASIHIPVVRSLGIDKYELVSDYLSYYAYLKARELDPELPEQLMVFIMDKKNEADILGQLKVTEKIRQVPADGSDKADLILGNLEGQVKQSSAQIAAAIAQLKTNFLELKADLLQEIDTKLPTPASALPPLKALNQILDPMIAQEIVKKLTVVSTKNKAQEIVSKLQELKQNHPNQEFKTFAGVSAAVGKNLKGQRLLTEGTMIKLIDSWN